MKKIFFCLLLFVAVCSTVQAQLGNSKWKGILKMTIMLIQGSSLG